MKEYFEVVNKIIHEYEVMYQAYRPYCERHRRILSIVNFAAKNGLEEEIIWELILIKIPEYFDHTEICEII